MYPNEGNKIRVKVNPLRLSENDKGQVYTAQGEYVSQTDLDRLYRRLELAEYFMENIKIEDSDFPLFMEWRQLKEENFAEFIYFHSDNVPTGEYFKEDE